MKNDSLKLIEDVVGNFAKLASIEISEDSIYLDFIDFGGGYGIPYHKLDDEKDFSDNN